MIASTLLYRLDMFNGYRSAHRDNEEDEDNDEVPACQARKQAADAVVNHSDPKPPKKRCGVSNLPH